MHLFRLLLNNDTSQRHPCIVYGCVPCVHIFLSVLHVVAAVVSVLHVVAAVVLMMLRLISFVCTALQLLVQLQCVTVFGSAMHKHYENVVAHSAIGQGCAAHTDD